jgi:hypothetical protein
MKSMESLSNMLNGAALNSCTAAKGLVTSVAPAAEGLAQGVFENAGAQAVEQGFTNSFTDFSQQFQNNVSQPFNATMANINSIWQGYGNNSLTATSFGGCNGIISQIFPSDDGVYPISVLDVIGANIGMPQADIDLMRGFYGDIYIDDDAKGHLASAVQPCSNNINSRVIDMINGNIESMSSQTWVCTYTTGMQAINTQVSTYMNSISQKLQSSSGTLSIDEVNFLSGLPGAVLIGLRAGVASGQSPAMIDSLTNIATAAWVTASLQDLFKRIGEVMKAAEAVKMNASEGANGCNLKPQAESLSKAADVFRINADKTLDGLKAQLNSTIQDYISTSMLAQRMSDVDKQIKSSISRQFGPSVADRVFRNKG